MPNTYTPPGRRSLLATSAKEPILILLEITHPDLDEPVRVVNDSVDAVITQDIGGVPTATRFVACPFQLTWPDDVDQQLPQGQLRVDNIGRELTQWLEYSNGGKGAKCRLMQALGSEAREPWEFGDYAEGARDADYAYGLDLATYRPFEYDITTDLTDISIDNQAVTATLGYQNTMSIPAVALRFDPQTSPALF